jgi:hypothetical protein
LSAGSDLLVALYPQYSADSRADIYLEVAALQHTAAAWGAVYTLAMVHFTAHLLMIADADAAAVAAAGNAGAALGAASGVTSRSAGDLAESYATARISDAAAFALSAGDAELMRTSAGQAYLRLRATRAATMPVVMR